MTAEETNYKEWLGSSIRQRVFKLLDENPKLSPKMICKELRLPYQEYKQYVWNLRSAWKTKYENEHRAKCSFHAWCGWGFVPFCLDRVKAVEEGWVLTKSRNRWLLWKDKLGRIEWFETGRINVWVRKPANMGKAYQLVCNGFSYARLISDFNLLQEVLHSLRFKGAHAVYETDQPLPKMTIWDFKKSNGVVVKLGDASHPKGIEIEYHYPNWAERNEHLLEQILASTPKSVKRIKDAFYVT